MPTQAGFRFAGLLLLCASLLTCDGGGTGPSDTIAPGSSYVSVLSWGGSGTGDGKFGEAGGVAIDAQGTIWVADVMNENIQQFDASGNFLNKFITTIETRATYDGPTHIGFTDAGDLYAMSTWGYWVARYDTSGNEEYLGSFSYGAASLLDFAVDPRNGDFYLVFVGAIGKVGGGEVLWSRELNELETVTVDSQGNVYVLAYPGIQKYDADGNLVAELDLGGEASYCYGCALDVDSSDRLYFLSTQYDGTYVKVFDGSLNLLGTSAVDADLWQNHCGLGVAGDGQFLYISIHMGSSTDHHNTVLKLERR